MVNNLLHLICSFSTEKFWTFFIIEDILHFSTCSRLSAGVLITSNAIKQASKGNVKLSNLGAFKLSFSSDLTIGMVRRIFNRLQTGTTASVSINNETGRVMIDIGSAFNDSEVTLASEVTTVHSPDFPLEEDDVNEEIFKHLEISSYDEYDDFNPRHPQMKNRAHRRGDSYFSSDIDMLANEPMLAVDIKNIADIIANDSADPPAPNLKNKFIKTRNYTPGVPPIPRAKMAAAALNADSDEDN